MKDMNSVRKFIFIRHGETALNAIKRMQFHTDEPLNDNGRNQAVEAGKKLAKLKGEYFHFVHSPLCRATVTAELVHQEILKSPHAKTIRVTGFYADDRLKERFGGSLDKMDWHEFEKLAKEKIPDELMVWDNLNLICPNAECSYDMIKRMEAGIVEAANAAHANLATPVVVGHLGAMDTFSRLVLGFKEVTYFKNATPYLFENDNGKWKMTILD